MTRTRFTRGDGALTAVEMNRQRDLTRVVERYGPALPQAAKATETPGKALPYFWAKITGYSAWGSFLYRWKYSFEEMRWEVSSSTFVTITGGIVGTSNAYNANEAFNTNAATVLAPGYLVANIPAGFSYQPIQGNPVVLMMPHVTQSGEQIFMFCAQNTIDGAC
jgi:hypothetical protein